MTSTQPPKWVRAFIPEPLKTINFADVKGETTITIIDVYTYICIYYICIHTLYIYRRNQSFQGQTCSGFFAAPLCLFLLLRHPLLLILGISLPRFQRWVQYAPANRTSNGELCVRLKILSVLLVCHSKERPFKLRHHRVGQIVIFNKRIT